MAKILILGGGFGGVVAAEALAKELGHDHEITLVARSSRFIFYYQLRLTDVVAAVSRTGRRKRSGHH